MFVLALEWSIKTNRYLCVDDLLQWLLTVVGCHIVVQCHHHPIINQYLFYNLIAPTPPPDVSYLTAMQLQLQYTMNLTYQQRLLCILVFVFQKVLYKNIGQHVHDMGEVNKRNKWPFHLTTAAAEPITLNQLVIYQYQFINWYSVNKIVLNDINNLWILFQLNWWWKGDDKLFLTTPLGWHDDTGLHFSLVTASRVYCLSHSSTMICGPKWLQLTHSDY